MFKKAKFCMNELVNESFWGCITCANCESEHMHLQTVDVFRREEEDGPTMHYGVPVDQGLRMYAMTGRPDSGELANPSLRRSGVRLVFHCEHCEHAVTWKYFSIKGPNMCDAQARHLSELDEQSCPVQNKYFKRLVKEINDCAEDYMGKEEMEFLSKRDDVVKRLYALEDRINKAFLNRKWKAVIKEIEAWRRAYDWIREQARKGKTE